MFRLCSDFQDNVQNIQKTFRICSDTVQNVQTFWFCLCVTPLSAIFQLYYGDQFEWWRKPEYPDRTTNPGQATGELYHLRLRVDCTFLVIYKAGREPTRIGDRLVLVVRFNALTLWANRDPTMFRFCSDNVQNVQNLFRIFSQCSECSESVQNFQSMFRIW